MEKIYLEYEDDKSSKFWEVSVTVRRSRSVMGSLDERRVS